MFNNEAQPLVSAVIITHNRKKLAERAINSVLGQTYSNIECIVIDDKSDDGTQEYLKSKFTNKIMYHYIPPDSSKGGNHARNIGISLASGNYIAFLDDDDIWLRHKIERQVQAFSRNRKIGMVYCLRFFCYKNKYCWTEGRDEDTVGDVSKTVFKKIITSTSTMMFDIDAIRNIGGFDENLSCWQETELMMRFCQNYKIDCVDEQLILYTVDITDPERLSNKFDNFEKSINYIENKYSKLIKGFSDDENKDWIFMKYKDAISRAGSKVLMREYYERAYAIKPSKGLKIKKILNYKPTSKIALKIRMCLSLAGLNGHFVLDSMNE